MNAFAEYAPLIAVSPFLIYAGLGDLRHLRISNRLVLCMAGVFFLTASMLPLAEIGMRLTAAGAVFLICMVLFCWRVLAGGDVKMMAAAMLFVPSNEVVSFGWSFSVSMIAAAVAVTALQSSRPLAARLRWVVAEAPGKLPMGAAISLALVMLPAFRWITA